jgi:2-dehydropantoate 2-reductase
MKIAIVGIGGVGGYYGGHLAKKYFGGDDVDVVFIARGDHLNKIKEKGLLLKTSKGEFAAFPELATDDPSGCGIFDVVLFCVKGYDLEKSAALLNPNIGVDTLTISLLNGVDNVERLRSVLTHGKVLNGCVYISSQVVAPGVVKQAGGSCKMFFGSDSTGKIDWRPLEEKLKNADIDAEYRTDITRVVWEKYLFISPYANATSYLNKSMGELVDTTEGKTLLESLLDEVLHVARAKGVAFDDNIREETLEKGRLFPRDTKTSMQIDFEKGKPAEIETFTGFIVKAGRAHGITVPYHEKVYQALQDKN